VELVCRGGLATLRLEEERPVTREEYRGSREASLAALEQLLLLRPCPPSPLLLLLLAQHSEVQGCRGEEEQEEEQSSTEDLTPWSSSKHKALAAEVLEKMVEEVVGGVEEVEQERKGLTKILVKDDKKLLKSVLKLLEPQLKEVNLHPPAPHCLAWLTTLLPHPHLGQAAPLLLPGVTRCLDSWLPSPRVLGARCALHLASTCPPTELAWFGRSELLHAALLPLLSQELPSLLAAVPPLLLLTQHLHQGARGVPCLPGPADALLDRVAGHLEMAGRGRVGEEHHLALLLNSTCHLLGVGVVRWLPRLSSLLSTSTSSPLLLLLPHLSTTCPEALAREQRTLLPALIRQAYTATRGGAPPPPPLATALAALVSVDLDQARKLCRGMEEVRVNQEFDGLIRALGVIPRPGGGQ